MYCTLEEAWGASSLDASASSVNDPTVYDYHRYHTNNTLNKARRPKRARRRRRHRETFVVAAEDEAPPMDEHDHLPVQLALHADAHSPSPTCPTPEAQMNDVSAKYHTAFARAPSLERVRSDAVDVGTIDTGVDVVGADVDKADEEEATDAQHHSLSAHHTSTSATHAHATTGNADLHDELQWMRNNLSHLNDSVQQLHTQMRDSSSSSRSSSPTAPTTTTQGLNTALYIITGGFVLVLLDVCYRAGGRA